MSKQVNEILPQTSTTNLLALPDEILHKVLEFLLFDGRRLAPYCKFSTIRKFTYQSVCQRFYQIIYASYICTELQISFSCSLSENFGLCQRICNGQIALFGSFGRTKFKENPMTVNCSKIMRSLISRIWKRTSVIRRLKITSSTCDGYYIGRCQLLNKICQLLATCEDETHQKIAAFEFEGRLLNILTLTPLLRSLLAVSSLKISQLKRDRKVSNEQFTTFINNSSEFFQCFAQLKLKSVQLKLLNSEKWKNFQTGILCNIFSRQLSLRKLELDFGDGRDDRSTFVMTPTFANHLIGALLTLDKNGYNTDLELSLNSLNLSALVNSLQNKHIRINCITKITTGQHYSSYKNEVIIDVVHIFGTFISLTELHFACRFWNLLPVSSIIGFLQNGNNINRELKYIISDTKYNKFCMETGKGKNLSIANMVQTVKSGHKDVQIEVIRNGGICNVDSLDTKSFWSKAAQVTLRAVNVSCVIVAPT